MLIHRPCVNRSFFYGFAAWSAPADLLVRWHLSMTVKSFSIFYGTSVHRIGAK